MWHPLTPTLPYPCNVPHQVLTEELGALVGGLAFGRSMRWDSEAAFSRPVRWLLALHGARVLPFAFGPLRAGAGPPSRHPRQCQKF